MRLVAFISALVLASLLIGGCCGQTFNEDYLLSYPMFTDTTITDSWRSWICIANPWDTTANTRIIILDAYGQILSDTTGYLESGASTFIRPRNLVGYDCSGSAIVTSDQSITGVLEKSRNNNQMTSTYNAFLFYIGPQASQATAAPQGVSSAVSRDVILSNATQSSRAAPPARSLIAPNETSELLDLTLLGDNQTF